jgi:hypothetical protein
VVLAVGAAGLALLYFFSPEDVSFYPRCGLFALTGLHCPGCGSLRALHHLAHGRINAALDANALLVITVALVAAWSVVRLIRRRPLIPATFTPRPWTVILILGIGFLFGVLRNLPWPPFVVLAP